MNRIKQNGKTSKVDTFEISYKVNGWYVQVSSNCHFVTNENLRDSDLMRLADSIVCKNYEVVGSRIMSVVR